MKWTPYNVTHHSHKIEVESIKINFQNRMEYNQNLSLVKSRITLQSNEKVTGFLWACLLSRRASDVDIPLKTLDNVTIGNCQRPVCSLSVSQHKHKITSLWKFELNWTSKLRENDERKKTPLVGQICVLSDKNKRLLARSL